MLNPRRILTAFKAWLCLFWCTAALAAEQTFRQPSLTELPLAAITVSVLLAVIGGAAYTAQKMAAPDGQQIGSIPLEIIKDVLTSVVIGLIAFSVSSYLELPVVVQAGVITLAGYGGSRVLEPALGAMLKWISRFGDRG